MAKGYKGPGMGRPSIAWDERRIKTFEVMMGLPYATETAVADAMSVSVASLKRWIREHYDSTFELIRAKKKNQMNISLGMKQYEVAMKGSIPMLIFLGKNNLGQSDKVDTDIRDSRETVVKIAFDPHAITKK